MKPTTAITKDFLERISQPNSQHHPDYLAYRRGEITRAELLDRLPHIAMIGDSVSTGIYVSKLWKTFRNARSCRGRDWFLNVDPKTKIQSVSRRLEKLSPIVATHHGGIGAVIDDKSDRLWLSRRVLGTRNFSGQISQLGRTKRFPDLILISIGHNNVDWVWWCPPDELAQPEARLPRQSRYLRRKFEHHLRRLIKKARLQDHRVAIVVFGLINFESYFKGREEAERRRKSDSTLYPHLETTYKYLISFRPEYRENVIRLTEMVNNDLRMMVDEFKPELESGANVQLRYSDALATADLSRAELLHAVDGWHASVEGHNVLAEAAFRDLAPSLKFLGIT